MNFNSFQQLIARILLISFFLQSCGGSFNSLIPVEEGQTAHLHTNTQASIIPTDTQPILDQELTAQGGHAVTFYEEAGILKADVEMDPPQGFSKIYKGLPVSIEKEADLRSLSHLPKKIQQRRIHVQLAQDKEPAKVVIYKGCGLIGGGKTGKEKEEEVEQHVATSEKGNEKGGVGKERKSYGTLKRDPKAKANYTLGKHYYNKGKQKEAITYFKKAEKAGYLKAAQYLKQIELEERLKDPKTASKFFKSVDKTNCALIVSEIDTIDGNIKQNTEEKTSGPELNRKRQELKGTLENIQGAAMDVSTSDAWEKNATIPIVRSIDELIVLPERAVDAVYQELNKSNDETDNGSSSSSSSEASSSQSLDLDIDEEIPLQMKTDKKIEEIDIFLSTIAHKNESSFTEEEQRKLYNISSVLQKEMEEISKVAYGEKNKPLIVLVGNTGAGKSTIAHWLTGEKMFSIKDFTIASNKQRDNKFRYIFSDTQNNTPDVSSKIAPGKESKTTTPELLPAPEGWVYADCPGFNDTRGTLQKIKNALYIQALLKHHKRVRFLFVMPAGIFDSSLNRGKGVADALANLKSMFKNPYKLKNNISLVVTHHIAGVHKCIDTIKKDLKEFADVEKDEALKTLLNDLAERGNGVALFSRPLELGLYQNNEKEPESISSLTTHDQSLLKQNNEEKPLVLKSFKGTGSTDFISLNFNEDVKLSIPDDAKLLLNKMSANLVERLKELLKTHIAEKIRIYFNEKIRNFKASVDALVDKCMQYYTPMALVFGSSKKVNETLEKTFSGNTTSHNKKSIFWIFGGSITGSALTAAVGLIAATLMAPSVLPAVALVKAATLMTASMTLPVLSTSGALGGIGTGASIYYIRKDMWREVVRKHFIEREAKKIKLKLYDFAIKLKKLNRDIFKNDFLKDMDFLNKINYAPSDISKIEETADLLDCVCGISGNDVNDCKHLLSQNIWKDVFSRVNEHIVKRFSQTPYDFYENVSAPDQMEQIPPSYVKYLTERIKDNNKLSHIPEEFLKHLLTNYLKEPDIPQAFSLTGPHLPPKKLEKLINFIKFCQHIYTDITTRDFVVDHMIPTCKKEWGRIIKNKNGIDRLHSNLLTIRSQFDAILAQPPMYEERGKYLSKQVPAFSREGQLPKLQADYIHCIEETNTFFQETLNRNPIDYKDLKHIGLAIDELNKVQQEVHMEFYSYFNDKQIDASIPPFIDTTDKNKEYFPKAGAVIAASFLHKTQLRISNENISILNVGFRNLKGVKSIFSSILKPLIVYKNNPLACFTERNEEVDYIAYIEKDKALKQKDKLVIVYSGSNSANDWKANVKIGHMPFLNLSVHEGIGELFTKSASTYCNLLIEKIKHYYENNPKPKKFKIIITGHSLGGALALLAAYHYKTTQIPHLCNILGIGKDNISIKTFIFGAPAIADEPTQRSIEKILGKKNIFRVWTINDPVVRLSENLSWHVGTSVPLCNISNNEFNFLDVWGPHLAERYLLYLQALQQPFVSETHKELSSILKEAKIVEMITMLRNGSLKTELPKSNEISIETDIVSEEVGPSFSQNFEGTTTSSLVVSSSEKKQKISCPKELKGKEKITGNEEEEDADEDNGLTRHQILFELANIENDSEAQYSLGQRAYSLWKKNIQHEAAYQEAIEWLEKAADQGHGKAIALLKELQQPMLIEEDVIKAV